MAADEEAASREQPDEGGPEGPKARSGGTRGGDRAGSEGKKGGDGAGTANDNTDGPEDRERGNRSEGRDDGDGEHAAKEAGATGRSGAEGGDGDGDGDGEHTRKQGGADGPEDREDTRGNGPDDPDGEHTGTEDCADEAGTDGGADEAATEEHPADDLRRHDSPTLRAARRAVTYVKTLTGRDPESVISIERREDGWRIGVEAVEKYRIPDTSDILAVYEVNLRPDLDLVSYRRTRRYARGQLDRPHH